MADPGSSIFNKRATEKLRSPDDLDKYVRVTNPSVWVALAGCVALLLGLLAWGIFGTVATNVQATSVCVKGETICFLSAEEVSEVQVGNMANVNGEQMKVASISAIPLSREEAKGVVPSDYLVSTLLKGDWAYLVKFESNDDTSFSEEVPLQTTITTELIAPISLIIGNNK